MGKVLKSNGYDASFEIMEKNKIHQTLGAGGMELLSEQKEKGIEEKKLPTSQFCLGLTL